MSSVREGKNKFIKTEETLFSASSKKRKERHHRMKRWSPMILQIFFSVKLDPVSISFRTQWQRFAPSPRPQIFPCVSRSPQYETCSTKYRINFSARTYFSFSIICVVTFSLATRKLFRTSRSQRFFISFSFRSSERCCRNKYLLQSSSTRFKFIWRR